MAIPIVPQVQSYAWMMSTPAIPSGFALSTFIWAQRSGPKTTNPVARALDALRQEAARWGAEGILDIRISHSHYKIFGSWVIEDVIVTGTAVRGRMAPPVTS